MVQLVLADEDRELVQVEHVVGVRCDLVWKGKKKSGEKTPSRKMTLLFAIINYFPPPLRRRGKPGPRPKAYHYKLNIHRVA